MGDICMVWLQNRAHKPFAQECLLLKLSELETEPWEIPAWNCIRLLPNVEPSFHCGLHYVTHKCRTVLPAQHDMKSCVSTNER